MNCPNCSNEVPETANVCGYCGHRLKANVPVAPSETPAQQSQRQGSSCWVWGIGIIVVGLLGVGLLVLIFSVALFGNTRDVSQVASTPGNNTSSSHVAPPKLVDKADIDSGIYADAQYLRSLANEHYSKAELDEMDRTFTYTIELDQSQTVFWMWGWCANDQITLDQNFQHIKVVFTLAGEVIPLSQFQKFDSTQGEQVCQSYKTALTDWQAGETYLSTIVTFDAAINDGSTDYPAGKQMDEYIVYVKP